MGCPVACLEAGLEARSLRSPVTEELEGPGGEQLELRGRHFVPVGEGHDSAHNSCEVLLGDAVSAEHNPFSVRKDVWREVRARSHPCGFEGTRERDGGGSLAVRAQDLDGL